jgi:hypothetical protein
MGRGTIDDQAGRIEKHPAKVWVARLQNYEGGGVVYGALGLTPLRPVTCCASV